MTWSAPTCQPFGRLPVTFRLACGLLVLAAVLLAVRLWPAWRTDDDLSHGPLIPLASVLLVFESRRDPRPRFLGPGLGWAVAGALLAAAALAMLLAATLYAAAVGWSHALVESLLAGALVLFGAVAWLGLADRRSQVVPFNWAAAVALAVWLFAAPTPPGTYARVALALQGLVTRGVVASLHALGIAAFRSGNAIELARTSVGVSEACSGVRSLISCLVAGLFLSAVLVRRPAHRVAVAVVAPVIGFGMNLVRALLLTLLAKGGVNIAGRWHDVTGAAIMGVTTVLVAGLAYGLHRREAPPEPAPAGPPAPGRSPLAAWLAGGLLAAAAAALLLAGRTQAAPPGPGPAPDLAALFPPAPAGWTVRAPADLGQFGEVLQTRALAARVYAADPELRGPHFTLYLAYWRAGQAPVSLVDAHTPDACWPGTGWVPEPGTAPRQVLAVAGRALPPAECRRFALGPLETRVWYWHLYGGRALSIVDPYSVRRLLEITLRYGLRRPQDQLFVRVSSNRPWAEIASLPALQQFFGRLQPLGL